MRSSPHRLVPVVLLAAGAAALAADEAPKTFGTQDLQVVTLSPWAFQPWNDGTSYFNACCVGESYRHPTAGIPYFSAPIDAGLVPNGAVIEQIDFYVSDSNAAAEADMHASLCSTWVHLDGTGVNGNCPFQTATSGTPGNSTLTLTPSVTIRYNQDVDPPDGIDDAVFYMLLVSFGDGANPVYTNNLRLRGARILYRRQISPPPSQATFNDVPTGHLFFQYVEALAASGITAGCGSGNYCPDAPLTRGQMAVFLSKALGLYWPGE
jgi:hypothetical protein